MGMRPSSQSGSTSVAQHLGTAYDTVAVVTDNIESVIEVADNIDDVTGVFDAADRAEAASESSEEFSQVAQAAAAQMTAIELINSTPIYPTGTVLTLSGYSSPGDGGGAQWKFEGVTGQTPSQSPADLGDALINDASGNQWSLIISGAVDARAVGVSVSNAGEANTYACQALINALILGGEIQLNESYVFKAVYDGARSQLPAGYEPNKEMRRANKALIIYEADSLKISGTGTIDRSGDYISDTSYSEHSSSIYISKSKNVKVEGINILGAQNDTDLYNGLKTTTSGNSIIINSGSDGCSVSDVYLKDGTNAIIVGINRTDNAQDIDPLLDPVTNTSITNIKAFNFEHPITLADSDNTTIDRVIHNIEAGTGGTSTGATQRGLFLHSCRNVTISNYTTNGSFKTGIFLRNYKALKNIVINGLHITQQSESIIKAARGTGYSSFEGIGLKFESDNCEVITVDDFTISNVAKGVIYTDVGTNDVTLSNGTISASSVGFSTENLQTDATNFGAITNHTQSNVSYTVQEDLVNFPDSTPNLGVAFVKGGSYDHVNLVLDNVKVKSQNRNARIYDCGVMARIINSSFEQIIGYSGARTYDCHITGVADVQGCSFPNRSVFNDGNDEPLLAEVANVTSITSFDSGGGYALYKYDGTTGDTGSRVGTWIKI